MRHIDFKRIYDEFCSYYKNNVKGESEYYSWLRALKLNEAKPYGQARESFKWAKSMLNFLHEDAENKYYGIIVGLPITSMNGNVYHERDLIAAALSLKGKHPSLNHKDTFWFNPENNYGTLTVVDAKYEDGAVEALLQVPKTAVCPICNGDKMTELIDKQKIINVSLEGTMNGAFEFSDPPFTLLTTDVLPGIPLARIRPLETILSEAFTGTMIPGKKKMKIIAKIKEDKNQNISNANTTVNTKSASDPNFKGTWGTTLTSDGQINSQSDNAKTAYGTSAVADNYNMQGGGKYAGGISHEQADTECPEGQKWDPEQGKCVDVIALLLAEQECPEGQVWDPEQNTCVDAPVEQECPEGQKWNPETETCEPIAAESTPNYQGETPSAGSAGSPDYQGTPPTGPTKSKPPTFKHSIPVGAPTTWPGITTGPSVVMGTSPHEALPSLEERKAAIKARQQADTFEAKAIEWEQKHDEVYTKLQQYIGANATLAGSNKQLEQNRDEAIRELHNKEMERDKWHSKYEHELALREEYKSQVENYKNEMSRLSEKYNTSMATNLELSKKLTSAHEDYLTVSQEHDRVAEALSRAKNEAKRIVKIRT